MSLSAVQRLMVGLGVMGMLQISSWAIAAGNVADFSQKDPSVEELTDALTPCSQRPKCCPPGLNCRGLNKTPEPVGVSLDQITFEFNSDKISPDARNILSKVGKALTSPKLSDVDFLIEGHTDASGSLQYNMKLSKRRAESVKRYLVEQFEIDPNRLKTEGKGPNDLLDKNNPTSGRNRRVVFAPEE